MRSYTPQISWHNRDPILSVDLQNRVLSANNDGQVSYRIATSGNDSHVIIWKTTINDNNNNKSMATTAADKNKPESTGKSAANKRLPNVTLECLADLTKHQRPVNVVRFSPNPEDNMLAAGDDEWVIYLWRMESNNNNNNNGVDSSGDVKPISAVQPIVANRNKRQEFCVKNNGKNSEEEEDDDEIQILERQADAISLTTTTTAAAAATASSVVVVEQPFGEDEVIATEVWKPWKILRGHVQDVSDVCWSPDGQRLASASVDNTAIIWDVAKGTKLHKIVEHKGFVQGVAFDPIGKYVATLSNDRNMRLIDVKSGRTVYRVCKMRTGDDGLLGEGGGKSSSSRLFYDDTLRSFCRRLAFSPGGEFLIAPSGILELNDDKNISGNGGDTTTATNNSNNEDANKYINTTYIFERKSLNKPSFYLPSKKYTIAVSCCPKLFKLQENIENQFQYPYRIVFAVATQDSVYFYDTQQTLPFGQVSQIHYLRLTDLQWSPDGRMLIVTSTDGFATFITFDAGELGQPYDGPTFNFDEIAAAEAADASKTSPVSTGKNKANNNTTVIENNTSSAASSVMTTPEADRSAKPKISTPSITNFFIPKRITPGVRRTPETTATAAVAAVLPEGPKPLSQQQNQQNGVVIGGQQQQSLPTAAVAVKHDKSPNILIPRKKIKLTPIETIDLV
ncbi:uncharacterized protein LOC128959035 [Oppia nitens]|uniref:uncharacterized protein LOC128959035 n=1 Tax=Oppia nitens TaxID=1686743 RepID=UPI0023DCD1F1|nr:uncharacterized protein LOC128959035 [Oppia nitens]